MEFLLIHFLCMQCIYCINYLVAPHWIMRTLIWLKTVGIYCVNHLKRNKWIAENAIWLWLILDNQEIPYMGGHDTVPKEVQDL